MTRTYWQGSVGTYCDLCCWEVDLIGEAGREIWISHCKEKHPHVQLIHKTRVERFSHYSL